MDLQSRLTESVQRGVAKHYHVDVPTIELQPTRKDFEGDITVVIFPMLRYIKGNPVEIGTKIGEYLQEHVAEIYKYNVVKGFLNLVVSDAYYLHWFDTIRTDENYGLVPADSKNALMVEYSSPNTNKPLHLGHIRNNLLGYSVAEILKASGHKVYKTQIFNDRGIHICKSMLAWQKFGNGETPESSGIKSDHLVGKYYVAFDKAYKKEITQLEAQGKSRSTAEKEAPILLEAQEMLRKWAAGDEEVVRLWKILVSTRPIPIWVLILTSFITKVIPIFWGKTSWKMA